MPTAVGSASGPTTSNINEAGSTYDSPRDLDIDKTQGGGIFGAGQNVDSGGIQQYHADPNAFQYGGQTGGAAVAAGSAHTLGASAGAQDASLADKFGAQQAPTINNSGFNYGAAQAQQARGSQQSALGLQQQAATGQAPSVAAQQMQAGNDAAIRSQQALAASARGPAALAMAQGQAAGNTAALQQQNVQQTGQLRAGEMADARNQFANTAGNIRQGDMSGQQLSAQNAQAQAGLQASQNALNQQGTLAATQLGQQAQFQGESLANQINAQQLQAQGNGAQLDANNFNTAQGLNQQAQQFNAKQNQDSDKGFFGGIMGAIGGAAGGLMSAVSDIRLKQGITPEDSGVANAFSSNASGPVIGATSADGVRQATQKQSNDLATLYQNHAGSMSDERVKEDVKREDNAAAAFQRAAESGAKDREQFAERRQFEYGKPGAISDDAAAKLAGDARDMQASQGFMYGTGKPAAAAALSQGSMSPGDASAMRDAMAGKPAAAAWDDLPGPRTAAKGDPHLWDDLHAWTKGDAASPRPESAKMSDKQVADALSDAEGMRAEQEGLRRSPTQAGRGAPPPKMTEKEAAMAMRGAEDMQRSQQFMYGSKSAPSAMLDQLKPYSYNYKPESGEDPARRRYGIMAQDLERSPMGASIVHDTPRGKVIDTQQAAGVNLAAMADLHKRLKAVEMAHVEGSRGGPGPMLAYGTKGGR